MKKIKLCLLLGLMTIIVVALSGCGSTKVNLNKYVTIDVSGYDSMGTASCTFDYESFKKDYADKIKVNSDNDNQISGLGLLTGKTSPELLLDVCVTQNLDTATGLSNGDTILLQWDCKDDMASEYFDCDLVYSDIQYTVSGLEDVDKINPFDYVDISFSGTSPYGSVDIKPSYNEAKMQYVEFSCDKNSGLSNGDEITVTAYLNCSVDKFVEKYGAVLGEKEKTFTVNGLPYYATSITEIPAQTLDAMVAQGEDVFRAHVAEDWSKPENLISISYVGNYFLTSKTNSYFGLDNYLYLVYKITATNPDPEETFEFYYYVHYEDVTLTEDGECTNDITSCIAPSSGWIATDSFRIGSYMYVGCESLDDFYNSRILSFIDYYEYTTTVQ